METAIEQLPPEEKALITLFYLQNKPIAEIAEILQFTVENIKVKLHRTRKKLYVMIQNDHRYE
jgi:RNA polymerase sigma-70 factor (ECF subfamily)